MKVYRPKGSRPKPDWSHWGDCAECKAKAGQPCVIFQSCYPEHNGQTSPTVHYFRRILPLAENYFRRVDCQ